MPPLRSVLLCTDRTGAIGGSASTADAILLWPDADAGLAWVPEHLAGSERLLCGLPTLDDPTLAHRLDEVMALTPAGVVLPAVVGGRALQQLGARLAVQEAERGIADGATRIVAFPADTPAGVFALSSLAGASRRLAALAWAPLPLAERSGIAAAEASTVLQPLEIQFVLAAAACGVPALAARELRPSECTDLCFAQARRRGFAGAIVSDGASAEAANQAFE